MNRAYTIALRLLTLAVVCLSYAEGQSLITGRIAGAVTDPTSLVVPNAAVILTNLDTGETQSNTTKGDGTYSFAQVKPGRYQVTVTKSSFANMVRTISVKVGQTAVVDFTLQISTAAETIEVNAGPMLISTDPGVVTSFTPAEVALLPAPGEDMTSIAFTAPEVVIAPGSGLGNFTVNGLPATSNLFTINGEP